jgi:hypothetical protein
MAMEKISTKLEQTRPRYVQGTEGAMTRELAEAVHEVTEPTRGWWNALYWYNAFRADIQTAHAWAIGQLEYMRPKLTHDLQVRLAELNLPSEELTFHVEASLRLGNEQTSRITWMATEWVSNRYPDLATHSPALRPNEIRWILYRAIALDSANEYLWPTCVAGLAHKFADPRVRMGSGARYEVWMGRYTSTLGDGLSALGQLPRENAELELKAPLKIEPGPIVHGHFMPVIVVACGPGTTGPDVAKAAAQAWETARTHTMHERGQWKWSPDFQRWIDIYNDFHAWCATHERTQRAFLKQRRIDNELAGKKGNDSAAFRKAHAWLRRVATLDLPADVSEKF